MTWTEALDLVVARTGHERYRELCQESRPDHAGWRRLMLEKAAAGAEYPSLVTQAGNALKAAVSFVADGLATVDQAEHDRRLGICRECPHFDPEPGRCRLCGCYVKNLKARLASEHCPDEPARW